MHDVVWDAKKERTNFAKHGVRFSDAATVLDDPRALTIEDQRFDERRWVTIGMDLTGHVCLVFYSYPTPTQIRIISARTATPREQKAYAAR